MEIGGGAGRGEGRAFASGWIRTEVHILSLFRHAERTPLIGNHVAVGKQICADLGNQTNPNMGAGGQKEETNMEEVSLVTVLKDRFGQFWLKTEGVELLTFGQGLFFCCLLRFLKAVLRAVELHMHWY